MFIVYDENHKENCIRKLWNDIETEMHQILRLKNEQRKNLESIKVHSQNLLENF